MFTDRAEAGRELAEALRDRVGADAVVLAIPRGGVVVGEVVARELGLALDVVIPRKIRAPDNPELGLGAIAPGVRVLDDRLVQMLGVSREYLEQEIEAEEAEIERRQLAYRGDHPPVDVRGRTAVVVDDGIATGGTMAAALRWARAAGAARVILAVPVAPPAALPRMSKEADELVVLETPEPFYAVGQWYRHFDQNSDREVVDALARAAEGGS